MGQRCWWCLSSFSRSSRWFLMQNIIMVFYTIVLGEGKGKSLEGKLQVSYCTSSKEIKKKSWLIKMFS